MHSSRKRTVRCSSRLLGGGDVCPGVSAQGGVCLGEGDCGGGCLLDTALLWTEFLRHACENITFRNYYCGR